MLDLLVEWYQAYGIMVAMTVVVGAALALPLPASLLLIAAGALAEHSREALVPLVVACIGAALVGDQLAFNIGRRLRGTASEKLPLRRIHRALHLTRSRGMSWIFLVRWLVPPMGPAVSYAAGILYFPRSRFTIATLLGEIVWVTGYVGIGASLGDQLDEVSTVAVRAPWVAAGAFVLALAVASGIRFLRRERREIAAAAETAVE